MTERSLQITYRKGRPFAAYLCLSRVPAERSARTAASADCLLIVDSPADGWLNGIQIPAPGAVKLGWINEGRAGAGASGYDALRNLGQTPLPETEFDPLRAA